MSNELFDKTCTEALGEHWSAFTSASENRSLKKLYAHMHKSIAELKEKLEIKNAVIERWEEEFDHMASQEFCEEIESISEGGEDE